MLGCTAAPRTQPAPCPLVGEGWGGGRQQTRRLQSPPSLSLPHKGGGNRVAHVFATIVRSALAARNASLCVAAVLLNPSTVFAQDFYAGKTLTVIAGLPPGGGVDGEMRVLTKYLPKYIPGHPAIISRNMPGAGGIILANHLYNSVAGDGLTLGMPGRSGFLLSNVVPQKGISYDLTRFSYVGGAGSAANALWLHQRTGITSL